MLQSRCLLRIGVSHVSGSWRPGRAGGRTAERVELYKSDGAEPGPRLGDAISSVLSQILPQRRLMAPYVSVALAGSHVRAAIMAFAKLPVSAKDRSLLISQRFCRENRLDAASLAVLGSPLGPSKSGGENVLCLAVPNTLLAEIKASLAARGLHADVIAPDYMLSFAEADTRKLEAPGIVLMHGSNGGTILVWNEQRTIVHVASFASGPDDVEGGRRTASRIFRYARIVGAEDALVAVYADGAVPGGLRDAPEYGLKLLPWPAGYGPWSQEITAAGL